jgi:hypothetical protein
MLTHKAALVLSLLLVCTANASQELQEAVVKTDIEAVKKILPTVTLNAETKQHLIDLANDVMLMRLKTEEIYSFKEMTCLDKKIMKKTLSEKTIAKVKRLNTTAVLWCCGFVLSFVAFCISMPCADHFFDRATASKVGYSCLIASAAGAYVSLIYVICNSQALQRKIRSNLQQFYCDSIEIKSLIANTAITI